jgi:hypothetical protein
MAGIRLTTIKAVPSYDINQNYSEKCRTSVRRGTQIVTALESGHES